MKAPTAPTTTNNIPWHSGETLTAAHNGKTLVPAEPGTSVILIPAGLPDDFKCSAVNLHGLDIRPISTTVNGIHSGVSFTTLLQYGVVNIRSYAQDVYSVTIEPQGEPVMG